MNNDNERVGLSTSEVARVLDCSVTTVNRYLRNGEISYIAIGPRLRRIPRASLETFIASKSR